MLRGFYTAGSGMIAQEKRLNAIANNIANVSTAGYKKDELVQGAFGEHIAVRMNTYNQSPLHRIGGGTWMTVAESKYTDYEQGAFEATGRSLDMCIRGDGFFVIDTPDGERLTRDGQFALDEEGYLVLPGYGRVQGQRGDIRIGGSEFLVAHDGSIYVAPEEEDEEPVLADRLSIALPEDLAALEKESSKLFFAENYATAAENPENTMVLQQTLERANVNMAQEMTRMIAAQRSLQSASQVVKMYDEMADQGNSRISSIR